MALIDLDPVGGVFSAPTNPAQQPDLALDLAVLRKAGVVIAWQSDLSVNESGALRTALEQSGLEPVISDGWLLIEPVFPVEGHQDK